MELDDLKASVVKLGTAVSGAADEFKAVADALTALKNNPPPGGINPADIEAAAVQIGQLADNLQAAVDATKGTTGV